jgi:hypothetical protein
VLGPPPLPADVRGFLRVTFDLPHATGGDGSSVFTQAWAVSANLRIDRDVDNRIDQQLNVTSQFVSGSSSGVTIEGVRLNTPGSLQQQVDQASRLDGPLDYARYAPIRLFPGFELPGATFVLDHAFCGYAAATNGHTPGSGKLRIRWFFGAEKRDQRVYSSMELMKVQPWPAGSTIGAVGVSIATLTGVGTFGARVRSNPRRVSPGPPSMSPPGAPSVPASRIRRCAIPITSSSDCSATCRGSTSITRRSTRCRLRMRRRCRTSRLPTRPGDDDPHALHR